MVKLNWKIKGEYAELSLFDGYLKIGVAAYKAPFNLYSGIIEGRDMPMYITEGFKTQEQAMEAMEEWLFNHIDKIIKEGIERLKGNA